MTTFTNTSLHVEAIGTDGGLWHRGLTNGTQFNAWESFGGVCKYYADAITLGTSTLHCFVIGMDNALWHKVHDVNGAASASAGWESLKGVCMTAPYVTSWGPNHIAVFVIGVDRAAWCCTWDGTKWEWASAGGKLVGDSLTACCWEVGRIDVFGIGVDSSLQHSCYAGGKWATGSTWESLAGGCIDKPKAISTRKGRIDVFVKGMDSALWHKCYDGRWLDWHSLGEVHQYNPEAVVWCPHRIDLFSTSSDTNLIHLVGDISKADVGTWGTTWAKIGGMCTSTPKACVRNAKLVDVFFKGSDSSLKRKAWDGNAWQPGYSTFENLAGGITLQPC